MLKESELKKLCVKTPKNERKYRVGNTFSYNGKKYGNMLCYVDARYVQDTFDKIVGPANWDNEFFEIKGALFCRITVRYKCDGPAKSTDSIYETSKMDCGSESNIEKEKGEASDSFKRAAVHFGVGRDLYSSENYKVELNQFNGKWYPPKNWRPENEGEK